MGAYATKCNLCKSAQINPSVIDSKSAEKPTIKLLLLGLDNAGKTTTALHLIGESLEDIISTIGFSNLKMRKFNNFRVVLYDLGGGPRIRSIWKNYFGLVHGIIFVIDSADISRVLEVKDVIEEVISNEKIAGKPILVLINKQDIEGALDEVDICKYINLEPLINKFKCLTRIECCSANSRPDKAPKIDPAIDNGYQWLMGYIERNWIQLNYRVETDSDEQYSSEKKSLEERIKRFREVIPKTEDNEQDSNPDSIKKKDPFKPIKQLVKDMKYIRELEAITDAMKPQNSYLDKSNETQEISGKTGMISDGKDVGLTSDPNVTSLMENSSDDTVYGPNLSENVSLNRSSPSPKPSENIVEADHHNEIDIKEEKIDSKELESSKSLTSPQSSDKSITSNRSHKKAKRKMKVIRNSKVSPVLSKNS